jgi:hypothetical protein
VRTIFSIFLGFLNTAFLCLHPIATNMKKNG